MGNVESSPPQAGSENGNPNVVLMVEERDSPRDPPPKESAPLVMLKQRRSSAFLPNPVINKSTERGDTSCGQENESIRYAISEMQGWRSHMEDEHLLNPNLYLSPSTSTSTQQKELIKGHHLFAVFDGHGGDFTSQFCGEHFVSTLSSQKDWRTYLKLSRSSEKASASVEGLSLLKSSLTSTFLELDAKLLKAQRKRRVNQLSQLENIFSSYGYTCGAKHDVFRKGSKEYNRVINHFDKKLPEGMQGLTNMPMERSGSTAVVVLITPSHILCANAGDSRAILAKRNDNDNDDSDNNNSSSSLSVLPLSFDHKPKNHVELTRVEKNQGFVKAGRVDGELAVSRGFGDFCYKNCSSISSTSKDEMKHTNKDNKNKVTVHPDILIQTREPSKDEFVVLACDGIWDVLKNRDCADLVNTLAHTEGESDVGLVCEEILDTGLELDSRDNMTCCVVMFPGSQNPLTPSSSSHGVLKRRINRMKSRELSITQESERLDLELQIKTKRLEERKRSQLESISRTRSTTPIKSRGSVQRPPIIQERKRSEEGRDSPLGHNDNEGKKFKASTLKTSTGQSLSLSPPSALTRLSSRTRSFKIKR